MIYGKKVYRSDDPSGLIRKRTVLFPVDADETVNAVLEEFAVAVDEIRETLAERPHLNIVLDAYVTTSANPLADDDHEPISLGD